MSTFATLAIILGVLSGLINFGIGIMRRDHIWVALMRFIAGLVSFAVAVGVIVSKMNGIHLPAGWHSGDNIIFLFIGLALFVGATLMLPSSIERNLLPAAAPQPKQKTTLTGKLSGEPGTVGVAKNNEEWVN